MKYFKNEKFVLSISLSIVLFIMLYMRIIMNVFNKYSVPLIFLGVSLFLVLYTKLKNKTLNKQKNYLFVFLLLSIFLPSFYNNAYIYDGMIGIYLYYVFSIMFGIVIYYSDLSKDNIDLIFKILIIGACVTSIITWLSMIFPNFYIDIIKFLFPKDISETVINDFLMYGAKAGLTDHYSRNAFFIITGILGNIYFYKQNKKNNLIMSGYFLLTLIMIGKRAHFLFLILSIIIFFLIINKNIIKKIKIKNITKILLLFLLAIFLIKIIFPNTLNVFTRLLDFENISNGRMDLYNRILRLTRENNFFPIGWGQFSKSLEYNFAGLHNDYLQILCETGIIGFLMIISPNIIFLNYTIIYAKNEKTMLSYLILIYNVFYMLYSFTGLPHYDFETNLIYYMLNAIMFCDLAKGKKQTQLLKIFDCKMTKKERIKEIRKTKVYKFLISIKHKLEYDLYKTIYKRIPKIKYKIISDEETVDLIVDKKMSIARYGDGEFKWIIGMKQRNFQDDNEEMKKRLIEVLEKKNSKLIVGIPSLLNSMDGITFDAQRYWIKFLVKSYKKFEKYLKSNITYCDSYITRPYMDRVDKSVEKTTKRYDNLKRIWNNKEIIIVEGIYSRLGVGNDLFDNAKKIERILCPPSNAYNKYQQIIEEIRKQNKKKTIILSLGPTATILAYDLAKEGYQAIDLGHIDIEYMWFKNNSKNKEVVKGKFVNEIEENGEIEDILDEKYKDQIITVIE